MKNKPSNPRMHNPDGTHDHIAVRADYVSLRDHFAALALAQKTSFCQTPVISRFFVPETLELIKEQTGLKLELCDYFTGIKEHNGRKYFNIILRQRTSESKEYDTLKRFTDKYKKISVEPNGLNRVAVFQNGL